MHNEEKKMKRELSMELKNKDNYSNKVIVDVAT
jgi:hypothetical protein